MEDAALQATPGELEDAGGVKYLAGVARENPQVFCALLGKLLPSEITGGNGGPMLSVLIEGKLHSNPVRRTSSKGGVYIPAQMRAAGDDGETVWCRPDRL